MERALISDLYSEAGPQMAIGGTMLQLLLGALILRWGIAWRNRLSDVPIRSPSFGRALGIMGLSLLVTVVAAVGLMGAVFVAAAGSLHSNYARMGDVVWMLAWIFLPQGFVGYFLVRAGILTWLLRIEWDDALVVQLCEMLIYIVAMKVLGLTAFAVLLAIH
jgi:hypothetical protein